MMLAGQHLIRDVFLELREVLLPRMALATDYLAELLQLCLPSGHALPDLSAELPLQVCKALLETAVVSLELTV